MGLRTSRDKRKGVKSLFKGTIDNRYCGTKKGGQDLPDVFNYQEFTQEINDLYKFREQKATSVKRRVFQRYCGIHICRTTVSKKIREGEIQKIPYILVVGDKEIKDKTVRVRERGKGDTGPKKLDTFLKQCQ